MTFNIDAELKKIKENSDIDVIGTIIKKILQLVNVASAAVFEKTYDELNGFSYKIEGGNDKINLESDLKEIQSFIENKSSVTFKYKMNCDNGNSKYSDLYFRSTRKMFIENMIKFINEKGLKDNLLIRDIKYAEESGGKSPKLYIQVRHQYQILSEKKGTIEKKNTNINFNFLLKYAGKDSDVKLKSLKPSHVTPSILDTWITPKNFYNAIIKYINGNDFPTNNVNLKNSYSEAVKNSYENKGLKDNLGIASDLSSEFFEILSCLKLGTLLESNNKMIKEIVGIFDDTKINMVEIYIPKAANERLIDYKVAINDQRNSPLQISVKSKVRAAFSATVKFESMFSNEAEVHKWFKELKFDRAKNYNIGQRTIASSALEYKKYSGKLSLYPLRAIVKLLRGAKNSSVKSDLNKILDISSMNISDWNKTLTILDKKISLAKTNSEPIDNLLTDKDLLIKTKKMIADNLFKNAPGGAAKTKTLQKLVNASFEQAEKQSPNGKYPFSLNNVALLCERVLVETSQKSGKSKLNFYKLFYDQVLKKRAVAYSIVKVDDSGKEKKLEYIFTSLQNFKQYKKWISLRTKNYANNMQDSLGLEV